ncbi:MAG: hypothetical protein F6K47_33665 [Symploca sp. SIO2E6]|nr:hypothetical protein [Symploca sp. SIO2E6]
MASRKTHKIYLNEEYPCPCRRRGCLVPITLTEAFGCNRCQQIFVLEENGYMIEQLSTTYPYRKAWRWTGNRWSTANASIGSNYLPVAILIVLVLLFVLLPLTMHYKNNIIFWALSAVLLTLILAFMFWLTYQR